MVNSVEVVRGASPLDIVPLGGLGEFGMNMMTYRMGDSMIVVDAGIKFPGHEHRGVNVILPDTSYLKEHKGALDGIVLTHAHEDHIGALPHIIRMLGVPVYGTKLTLGMVRKRLAERDLLGIVDLREITPGESFAVGDFGVELVHVTHSLADAVAVVLDTPFGKVLHTGDFKVDDAPPVGPPIDLKRLAAIGNEGVLCMLSDSTNAEVPGSTGSEASVLEAIEEQVRTAPGRVLVCCFTSSTHRIQLALDAAAKMDRKVFLAGRSMVDNIGIASDLGYMRIPGGLLRELDTISNHPRSEQLVIAAGSQGEQLSALSQIASGNHRHVKLEAGDRVILSARVIPGNELAVNRLVNKLFRDGIDVIQRREAQVHVSGHAAADDLDMVLRLVKPSSFIPIHGEWRQLYHHARIARESGVDADQVFIAEDGHRIQLDGSGAKFVDQFDLEPKFVDASGLGLVDDCIVRDRRNLSETGVVVPMISLSGDREPYVSDILTRGFIENNNAETLLSDAHDAMLKAIDEMGDAGADNEKAIEEVVEATLKRFFRKRSVRRPVILPVVVESEPS